MKQYTITLVSLLSMGLIYSPLCGAGISPLHGEITGRITKKIEEKIEKKITEDEREPPEWYSTSFVDKNKEEVQASAYQVKVDAVVRNLFEAKDIQPVAAQLKQIDSELTGFYQQYWKAYLYYYEAVFYQTIAHKEAEAEKAIDASLAILQRQSYENSEYYALLAMCTSFSIQYVNILKLSRVSAAVIEYGQKALALNKSNLRAYYILASHNYHTPKMFGGMEKVEDYALKGLTCPDSLESSDFAPSWGRELLYQLLVHFYEKEGRTRDLQQLQKNHTP